MKYEQLVARFGGVSKAARALGATKQAVFMWKVRGRVPARWQIKAESVSGGELRADKAARLEALEIASYLRLPG